MKSTLSDKLQFTKTSLQKNSGPLLIMLLFVILGAFLIYLGLRTKTTFLWIFGAVFGGLPLLGILFTIPSSILYHYEQVQIKKYGTYGMANIIEKEEKDVSYIDKVGNRRVNIKAIQYFLTYAFEHNGQSFQNTFLVAGKNCFDTIEIGKEIPIRFLRTNPKKSTIRRSKLANELGLPIEDCQ